MGAAERDVLDLFIPPTCLVSTAVLPNFFGRVLHGHLSLGNRLLPVVDEHGFRAVYIHPVVAGLQLDSGHQGRIEMVTL